MNGDATDLKAALAGDEEAFARFYDRHAPIVLSLCRRQTWSLEEAEDATVETFLRASSRLSLLTNPDRPHLFIRELAIYVEHLREEFEKYSLELSTRAPKYFREFKENLLSGIEYYCSRAEHFIDEKRNHFLDDLQSLRETLERMTVVKPVTSDACTLQALNA